MMNKVKKLITYFLDLIYPRVCITCNTTLKDTEKFICYPCFLDLPRLKYSELYQKENEKKFWGKVNVQAVYSLLYFSKKNKTQKLIHELKYKGNSEIGEWLGNQLASEYKNQVEQDKINLIIGIPLHDNKLRQRGYNQADIVAEAIAKQLNIEYGKAVLKRIVETKSQTKKSRLERFKNIEGIYAIDEKKQVEGKNVLIVDDVLTTGATLTEAIELLLNKGANTVSIMTIASAF